MSSFLKVLFVFVCFSSLSSKAATVVTLINEDFATGTGNYTPTTTWSHNGLNWIWSGITGTPPSSTEVYSDPFPRMPRTHGGFEVFSTAASEPASGSIWQVAVQVALPSLNPPGSSGNTISFDMGYRAAVSVSSFELYNITDNRSIVSQSLTGSLSTWSNVTINPAFTADDAGDTVELRWRDTASSSSSLARGLEVGAVRFDITPAPEPSALSLLAVGLGGVLRQRRRTV